MWFNLLRGLVWVVVCGVAAQSHVALAHTPQDTVLSDDFTDPNGTLLGHDGWTGDSTDRIAIESNQVKVIGGATEYSNSRDASTSGSLWFHFLAKAGTETGQAVWCVELRLDTGEWVQWLGRDNDARGGYNDTTVTSPHTMSTTSWSDLDVKIDFAADEACYYANGLPLGCLAINAGAVSVTSVRIRRTDNAAAAGASTYLDTFRLGAPDTTAPTGTVTINGGAAYTSSTAASLTLTATDGAGSGLSRMRFSDDGSSWSGWEAYAGSKSWTLLPGDGVKTVHAQFEDFAGNQSAAVSDTIALDTTPPVITCPGDVSVSTDPGANHATVSVGVATAVDATSGVGAIVGARSDGGGLGETYPKGSTTITWTATDLLGNSSSCSQRVDVTDNEPPVITGALADPAFVNTQNVTVAATATDNCTPSASLTWQHRVGAGGAWKSGLTVANADLAEGANTIYVRATDIDANTSGAFAASPTVVKDTVDPSLNIESVTQGAVNLLLPGTVAVQGVVDITVSASDTGSGLAAHPTVTVEDSGSNPLVVTYIDEDPSGTFNYQITIDETTANGTATISAEVSDGAGNSETDSESFEVDKNQVTGTVSMDTLSTASYGFNRNVVFAATDAGGTLLATWTVAVTFANSSGIASGPYVLTRVPETIARLSAKSSWSLRQRLDAALDIDGQATDVDFSLKGGDLDGSNSINILDYVKLKTKWYTPPPDNASADINGDGSVQGLDYSIMKLYWFWVGNPL